MFDLQTPQTEEEWEKVSDDFSKIWHFPHCIGAMDGKHIVIEAPTFSGSEFFNYKGTFSVVLFAVVDANYNFLYANVGCQGRISDGGVFKSTPFYKQLIEGKLNLPTKRILPGRSKESPYVLVADDAFPLKPCIMKPYSGHQDKGSIERVFNYRICRARRIVENVFGILASVFRVFRKPMLLQPEKVEKVTLACICLHNYLRSNLSKNKYNPAGSFDIEHIDSGNLEDGAWRQDQQTLQSFFNLQQTARKSSVEAMEIRKEFAAYFVSEQGQVPWQLKFC